MIKTCMTRRTGRSVSSGLGLALAATALLCTSASAQIPSMSASFTGESIMTTPQTTISARVYGMPGKLRTDSYVQGMSTVSVMDMNAQEVLSWSPDPNSGMGRMAMRLNYSEAAKQYGVDPDTMQRAKAIGRDRVAGHECSVYSHEGMTACITYDGIVLRSEAPSEGYKSEMTSMTRGPQPASYFQIPAGYNVVDPTDMSSIMGAYGGEGVYNTQPTYQTRETTTYDERIANEAARQTDRRVDDAVSDQAGGLMGDIMGEEAGALVGGLFGKKKKKKKKKTRD